MKLYKIIFLFFILTVSLTAQDKGRNVPFVVSPSLAALQVSNLDSAEAWYVNNLGFNIRDRKDFPDYGIKISFIELNGYELELVENIKSIKQQDLLKNYPGGTEIQGITKLTFKVDDIKAAEKHLKKNGVKFYFELQEGNDPARPDEYWLIVSDYDGNWIQLVSGL